MTNIYNVHVRIYNGGEPSSLTISKLLYIRTMLFDFSLNSADVCVCVCVSEKDER